MPDDILKLLSDLGFHKKPRKGCLWRSAEGAGNVKGLDSFGMCHAIATDGVHMIVRHGDGKAVIEIHETNWIPNDPTGQIVPKGPVKPQPDKEAAALTRLFADLQ